MAIGFAGSRCVDERRRRRLAQEVEQETPAERRSPLRARAERPTSPPKEPPPPFVPRSPIESIVRPQLWVSILFTVLGLAAWGGLLVLGDWIDRTHAALSAAFGLREGLLVRSLRAGCLLFAAQLSYVILWHRIRSRKDFSGRYQVWAWVVPTWLVFAFAIATDAHWLAGRAAEARWPMNVRDMDALCWLIPAAAVLLGLSRLLRLEMRHCGMSVWCLRLSMGSAALAAVTLLAGHLLTSARAAFLIGSVSSTFWPVGLVISFWYYARHVIHVTNEPAELPATAATTERVGGRLSRLRRWWSERSAARAAVRAERTKEREAARAAAAAAKEAARAKAAEKAPEGEPSSRAVNKPAAAKPTPPADDEEPSPSPVAAAPVRSPPPPPARTTATPPTPLERPAATPRPQERPATARPVAVPERMHHFDAGDDADEDVNEETWSDEMQGLSKKERKRLRKLQRQRQRAM